MSHLSLSKKAKTGLQVQQKPTSTSLLEPKVLKELCPRNNDILDPKKEETSSQGKSSNSKILKDQTCFRCHKIGHFVVACPTKHVLKETSLENKSELFKMSDSFIKSDLLVQNSCIMHLSLPESFDPRIKKREGTPNRDQKMKLNNTSCPKKKIILQLVDAIKVSLELSHYV